jgi:ABC-type transport system involved in multi-copper enzyme maturation permease subunit
MHAALIVARFTLLESRRSGLPWLALAALAAALGLAAFLSQVALTEGARLQAAAAAALLRAAAAFLVAAHVVSAVGRDASDKGLEFTLAFPVSRTAYYLGKLAGFGLAGLVLATAFAAPMLLWSGAAGVGAWWLSLALEVLLVAAAALFFAMALAQPAAALAATAGLYLLGRAIGAIQAIAAGPHAQDSALAGATRWVIDGVALLLPRLDLATRSDWLVYGAPGGDELARVLGALLLYAVLLCLAGLFDLGRRNL